MYFRYLITLALFFPENLLDRSADETWPTDTNLNRVSVIQFRDDAKNEEEDETAAERRVSIEMCTGCSCLFRCHVNLYTVCAGIIVCGICEPAGSSEESHTTSQ